VTHDTRSSTPACHETTGIELFALTVIVSIGVFGVLAAAQTTTSSPDSPVAVFPGHGEGRRTFFDTQLSKAGTVQSEGRTWSRQKRYMICEQPITDSRSTHGRLTVFVASAKPDEVRYATLNDANAPSSGIVSIHNNVWTFLGERTNNGVTRSGRRTRLKAIEKSFEWSIRRITGRTGQRCWMGNSIR
jgi:hypothetical protein